MSTEALIFGATGAIGRELLALCLDGDQYARTNVIARSPTAIEHENLRWIESEFDVLDQLEPVAGMSRGDAYCCLGTTIKKAGSRTAFQQVDFEFVRESARLAKRSGARQFSLVSAIGADPSSRAFYSRVKGEAEAAVIDEDFPVLRIYRPSLLKGERDEFRLGEEFGNLASMLLKPVFRMGLQKYAPIEIATVAAAMYANAADEKADDGCYVYASDEIRVCKKFCA